MQRGLGVLIAFLLISGVGCDRDAPHELRGEIRDSAGVRIIQMPSPEALEPVRSLGIDSSWSIAARLTFGELVDVKAASADRLLLLDRLASTVFVLSPVGQLEQQLGREGSGPGEFNPEGLTRLVVTDTSVMIPDVLQQRLAEFSLDGALLGDWTFPTQGYAVDWRGHPEGGLVYRLSKRAGDLLIHWNHQRLDTIFTFQAVGTPPNMLLPPVPLWNLGPAGSLVLGRTDKSSIEARGNGIQWSARRLGEVKELDDAGRATLESVLLEFVRRSDPSAISAELLQQIQYPTEAPVLSGLIRVPNGDIWVQVAASVTDMGAEALRVSSAEGYGGRTWVVLTSGGFLKERIELPLGFAPRQFTGEWIYGIQTDELGRQQPARVLWRLE